MTATANPTVNGSAAARRRLPRRRGSAGFTYLSVIILVAIIGLVAATSLKVGGILQRSRAEQELLTIGAAFADALQSYADATPAGLPPQPPALKDLLKDTRQSGVVRRHLRKIFVDPMTGKAEWGVVYLGDKVGVVGVYSLSDAQPVKIGNFPPRFQGFEGKRHLSEWRFVMSPKAAPQAPGAVTQGVPVQDVAPTPQSVPAQPAIPPVTPENPPSPSEEPPGEPPAPLPEPPSPQENAPNGSTKL